jgi:hypothetical protein
VDETFIGGKSWNKHDYGDGKGTGGIGSGKNACGCDSKLLSSPPAQRTQMKPVRAKPKSKD